MDHREGASETGDVRLDFDRRVGLEFHGSKISSDGGLLLFRELDDVLGLHDIAGGLLRDTRTGNNRLHSLVGLLRQSVFGRLAGYDDVNDADRLAFDPVMRQVVGGRAVDAIPNIILSGVVEQSFGVHFSYADFLLLHYPVLGVLKSVIIVGLVLFFFPAQVQTVEAQTGQGAGSGHRQTALMAILLLTVGL